GAGGVTGSLKRGEWRLASFPPGTRSGSIHEDAEDPGPQGGAALEPAEPREHSEPRVLYDFLGLFPASHEGPGEPQHGCVITIEEPLERGLITIPEGAKEFLLLVFLAVEVVRGRRGRKRCVRQRTDALPRAAEPLTIRRMHRTVLLYG